MQNSKTSLLAVRVTFGKVPLKHLIVWTVLVQDGHWGTHVVQHRWPRYRLRVTRLLPSFAFSDFPFFNADVGQKMTFFIVIREQKLQRLHGQMRRKRHNFFHPILFKMPILTRNCVHPTFLKKLLICLRCLFWPGIASTPLSWKSCSFTFLLAMHFSRLLKIGAFVKFRKRKWERTWHQSKAKQESEKKKR